MGRSHSGWIQRAYKRLKEPGTRRALAAAAAGAALLALGAMLLPRASAPKTAVLAAEKSVYRRYEIVTVRLDVPEKWRPLQVRGKASLRVLKGGQPVRTIGGRTDFPFSWDEASGALVGGWPVPWNAPEGEYLPETSLSLPSGLPLEVRPFRIEGRRPIPVEPGFIAVTYEGDRPLGGVKVTAPDGTRKDWRGLLDWAQHLEADAFWMLAGVTPGRDRSMWLADNLDRIQEVGREAHKRGLKFGVWAMCYLTAKRAPHRGYRYALELEDGRLVETRGISIKDPRRPDDLAEFLGRFAAMPEVDFIGLDYIRNALGGDELAADFIREMPGVQVPAGWEYLSEAELQRRFARKTAARDDRAFIDQFQWWRAHTVAGVVSRIRASLPKEKPIYAFTLGWEKGWQHGQDVLMMTDAGVDVDSVMLYEADSWQFGAMMEDWSEYLGSSQAQVIVADVIDWPLHQFTIDPSGPDEYLRRTRAALAGFHADGPPRGLFVHDLSRLLWGRKGPYTTEQWAEAAKTAVREAKRAHAGKKKARLPAPPAGLPAAAGRLPAAAHPLRAREP